MDSSVSQLEIIDIHTRRRSVVARYNGIWEAPNWARDGRTLVINHSGGLYRVCLDDGTVKKIDTGFADQCNNDHGISPDGSQLAISHHDPNNDGASVIYRVPINGGQPHQVTENSPSYWHGWSPDGSQLVYVAKRDHEAFNLYTISAHGGKETRMTFSDGHDDGPEFSADGKTIYFNRFEQRMQIWALDIATGNISQIIHSNGSDWFPHPCPNGRFIAFLRYLKDQGKAHPFGCEVKLCLFDINQRVEHELTDVFCGGQGSINVPSWSPCATQVAFFSYHHVKVHGT